MEKLLNDIQAAELLGISPMTLRKDRCYNTLGIPFVRIGKSIRYQPSKLLEWVLLQSNKPNVTSKGGQKIGKRRGRPTKVKQINVAN